MRLQAIYFALPPYTNLDVYATEDCTETYNWRAMLTPDEIEALEKDATGFDTYIWGKIVENDKMTRYIAEEDARLRYILCRRYQWKEELRLDEEWALRDSGWTALDALINYKLDELGASDARLLYERLTAGEPT